jgi:hypothetical protein
MRLNQPLPGYPPAPVVLGKSVNRLNGIPSGLSDSIGQVANAQRENFLEIFMVDVGTDSETHATGMRQAVDILESSLPQYVYPSQKITLPPHCAYGMPTTCGRDLPAAPLRRKNVLGWPARVFGDIFFSDLRRGQILMIL